MKQTDTNNPEYFGRVVDCQWGCPAHTDVPEYIRLIAEGRFSDAYMVNRASNVFPGILGRVCDRPCEPECRRGRVEENPVAICRLKRVAADLRDDVSDRLPKAPKTKNGKRIACIGAGPASLAVANDLAPLGYDITIFEAHDKPGGLMRTNIPAFRLPAEVLDEEIAMITNMGVDLRLGTRVDSMKALLEEGYDAVFVGSGAPKGKELNLPGRHDTEQIFIGIDWLESVAFDHTKSVSENVIIIGAGNTAMDCCRTALRLGGKNVVVAARKPRHLLKASDWELDDAIEENVDLKLNHSPEEFVIENGKLVGVKFARVEWQTDEASGRLKSKTIDHVVVPADTVILAVGQENAFPWIERDIGIGFNEWDEPDVDRTTFQSNLEGVFFGGDAAFGPENIIWAVEHGHQAAISIHKYCQGRPLEDRPAKGLNLISRKMGMHEWSYSNDFNPAPRRQMKHVELAQRFKDLNTEVELGFDPEQTALEVQRCLNCDVQTVFSDSLCIECDACVDICPVDCLSILPNADEQTLRDNVKAPADNPKQPLFVSGPLKDTARVMVKDEDICVHCGLCAERCPTAAWDMQKSCLSFPQAVDEENEWQNSHKKSA